MTAFNGRLVSALSPDRVYRVRIELGDVHFVQVGGRSGRSSPCNSGSWEP